MPSTGQEHGNLLNTSRSIPLVVFLHRRRDAGALSLNGNSPRTVASVKLFRPVLRRSSASAGHGLTAARRLSPPNGLEYPSLV